MASNKECVIIILDVRSNADETSKQNAIRCTAEILKDKICSEKPDYVSFILMGTQKTKNDIGQGADFEGYEHITQYPQVQLATWELLLNFFRFVREEESCTEGDWLDALVVAIQAIKNTSEVFKFKRSRIILFHDFDGPCNNFDHYDVITENILKEDIELIVVAEGILYIDNPSTGEPQAIFASGHKSIEQIENQKYAQRLRSSCNAKLCNFQEAYHTVFVVENKNPWTWKATLRIGSKIVVHVSGIIAIKDESKIKLKKKWCSPEEIPTREVHYYLKGKPEEPLILDETFELIDGYMLGGTPVPYDSSLELPKKQHDQGLRFLGFLKRSSIPDEYFCGDSLYWLVHQKGMTGSAKKMDALVRAMLEMDMVIMCWKVYSEKFNRPKCAILIPNPIRDDRPATMTMVELSYHAQHHFWNFPSLRTEKSKCTKEQIEAIDDLIDSMDLTLNPKEGDKPREVMKKDLLPFDKFPHIYEKNIMDMLERKILSNATDDDEFFNEILKDKNFVEVYWKVPAAIEEQAKEAAAKVKRLFPLEKNRLQNSQQLKIKKEDGSNASTSSNNNNQVVGNPNVPQAVRTQSPGEDFEQLLKYKVLGIADKTLRDRQYSSYAEQLRLAVRSLLQQQPQDIPSEEKDKVILALEIYRKSCFDFNAFDDYNTWIREMKALICERHLTEIWKDVVQKQLGLCIVGEATLEEKIDLEEFYQLNSLNESDEIELNEEEMIKLLDKVEGVSMEQ